MKENNRAEISLQELTDVDKEVKIKATREELEPQFQAAFKKYRSQIQMPGFRPGKVPLSIVKKRFGSEIEMEEINKFVQEVFEKEVVPEHDPVGGSEMTDLQWESDLLEVTFKIGVRPVFELADLSSVEVEKMVHDVTDDEVEEELRRILEKEGNFEDVDEMVTGEHRVVVDVVSLNEDGEPIEGESDTNQTLDLKDEGSADFLKALEGKSAGDTVEMELGEGEEKDRFRLTLKKVQKAHEAKLTDEFAQKQSNEEARNSDEFKSWLRSRIQNYYDQTSSDLFRQDVISSLVEAHDFSIPEVFAEQILNNYAEQLGQQAG
ncbi:MAG: trigger factor, partial [Balneolaceae bacterium]